MAVDPLTGGEGGPLLPRLVEESADAAPGTGALGAIVEQLLRSPVTDAERAGERLRVFGWEGDHRDDALVWEYRVVGEASGSEYVRFALAVRGSIADAPLALFGLQLQIALNGLAAATESELACYEELARASLGLA